MQQQKITSSTASTPSTRKSGKQKNKNSKNNQQRLLSSTSRPFSYTTVMLNQIQIANTTSNARGKGGKSNQTKSPQTSTTTSFSRPRPTAKLPNTKSNNNLQSSTKFDQKYSNIYGKSSGKAPKQVKDNSYTLRMSSSSQSTVLNPSILKMFERYEKIEEIFPELEPHGESINPIYFTNAKPSLENTKSFSNFVSSFDSTTPQKKNTQNNRSDVRQKEGNGGRNGKGTQFAPISIDCISLLVPLLPFFVINQ